jgi:hypothetical protein
MSTALYRLAGASYRHRDAALADGPIGRPVRAKDPHRPGKVPRPGPGYAGQEQKEKLTMAMNTVARSGRGASD